MTPQQLQQEPVLVLVVVMMTIKMVQQLQLQLKPLLPSPPRRRLSLARHLLSQHLLHGLLAQAAGYLLTLEALVEHHLRGQQEQVS
jgi:hypothetical protein